MLWTPQFMASFVRDHLGPVLAEEHVHVSSSAVRVQLSYASGRVLDRESDARTIYNTSGLNGRFELNFDGEGVPTLAAVANATNGTGELCVSEPGTLRPPKFNPRLP